MGAAAVTYRDVVDPLPLGRYHENFPEIHLGRGGETRGGGEGVTDSRSGAQARPASAPATTN